MRKPAAIAQLEDILGITIPKIQEERFSYRVQPHYASNKASQITTIGLADCKIKKLAPICAILQKLTHLTGLILSHNEISDLTPLKKLTHLEKLYLDKNKIQNLAPLIELKGITTLYLRGNNINNLEPLTHLPALQDLVISEMHNLDTQSLARLTQLAFLDLSTTMVRDISFLRSIKNLRYLNLGNNPLEDISPLKLLVQLENLSLMDTNLEDLSFISGLTNLIYLNVSFNPIADLTFLSNLTKVNVLGLEDTKASDISPIGQLKHLYSLFLGRNAISDISSIRGLSELEILRLDSNSIVDISPLKRLSNLKELYLSNNQIADITPLAYLKNLNNVDLTDNQVKVLPLSLLDLRLLIRLDSHRTGGMTLNNNPLSSPPLEIVRQGKEAIIKWLDEEKVAVNEVKVLLVGHGEVGKTTLVKSLLGKTPDPKEPPTHHININNYQLNHKGKSVRLNFWDFGGQEVMHSTHQFFLSTRSIYLLLLDGRRDEDAEYWLKHVESFGGSSPVLVVMNKIDTNPSYDVDRRFLQTKYPFIKGFYKTACFPNPQGISELWEGLRNLLDQVEILASAWPKTWLHIKEELETLKDNFISQSGYDHLCASCGVTDESSKTILADYLNDLGIIVHFKDLRLSDLHILQPRWASRAAYKIINEKRIAENNGLLKADWLTEIMKKKDDQDFDYPAYVFPYILDLMQKFELCFVVSDKNEYLIPELMDIQQPELPAHQGPVLRFFLKFEDLLPRSIIARFIVRMHEDIKDELRWRTGTVLKVDIFKTLAFIIADLKERKIHISVSGPNRKEHFAIIRRTFHSLTQRFQRLNMTEWIPLPDAEDYSVEYQELIGYEANNKQEIFFGKLGKTYKVADLLNGIEPENVRKQEYKWPVFFCYSSLDKSTIQNIAFDMEKRGIFYWLDEQQIKPGDSIIDKITEGLHQSGTILLCISRNQLSSGWSRREYNSVLNRYLSGFSNQRIVPLVLDDTPASDIPPFLADIKNVHYTDNEAYSYFLSTLMSTEFTYYTKINL